jgi:hypothetical protein
MSPDVRWGGRSAPIFAEVAEALETTTDLIMAASEWGDGTVVALATPRHPDDLTVVKATLRRDAIGILRVLRSEEDPGLWDEIRSAVDDRVGGEQDEGEA